jgi:hypothetical protein
MTPRRIGVAFEGEPTKLAFAKLALVVGWLLGGYLIYRITRPNPY